MFYCLMNKDSVIATFTLDRNLYGEYVCELLHYDYLPLGFTTMESWLESRQSAKHRKHIKRLMVQCGCDTLEGYIRVLHCTGINDTFWVKKADETCKWADVSLYSNEFDENITRIAFEGTGLYGEQFSATTPEVSLEGSFEKCCTRWEGMLSLIKRGSSGAANTGYEPYCEYLSSPVYQILTANRAVDYKLLSYHGKPATMCRLFTNEKIGFASYGTLNGKTSLDDMLRYYASIGDEDLFRRMLVADAVCFNTDRHVGNHGVCFDTSTLEVLGMAPIFDGNLTLLPYMMESDYTSVRDYLSMQGPRIGNDWVTVAKAMLTPNIRRDLINIKGYGLYKIEESKFPAKRREFMNHLIDNQITAILS